MGDAMVRWLVVGALVAGLALPGCVRKVERLNTTTGDARGVAGSGADLQRRDLEQILASKGRVAREGDMLRASVSSDVLFESGSARLQPGADAELAQIAEVLKRQPGTSLEVTAHTDNRGTERYNQELSERRAATIRDSLVKSGVDASRIRTRGEGEHEPIATNDTATGRATNRRVDITIRPDEGLAREQSAPSEQP
jgi:outer membrane protein OmpA-like peptidoglycan-associated protein